MRIQDSFFFIDKHILYYFLKFSRSAVNSNSGVRTPLGGIFTGLIIVLCLAVLIPYCAFIPKVNNKYTYTGLPTKDGTKDTTVGHLYCLFPYILCSL